MMRGKGLWRLCLVAGLLAGCAGYHLGPAGGQTSGSRTVQVAPFSNKTLVPRLTDYVMSSLRKNLAQDGTYRLDTHDNGDVILSGEITEYQRIAISVQSTDVLTAQDYEIIMTAQVTARERASGKVLFTRAVTGKTTVRAGADLNSAEREVIPMLTDDFARKATSLLVDGTW